MFATKFNFKYNFSIKIIELHQLSIVPYRHLDNTVMGFIYIYFLHSVLKPLCCENVFFLV